MCLAALGLCAAGVGAAPGSSFPNITGSHVLFAPFTMEPTSEVKNVRVTIPTSPHPTVR